MAERSERPARGGKKSQEKGLCFLCRQGNGDRLQGTFKLRKFISEKSKIVPRRISGNCESISAK